LSVENARCFGPAQELDLSDGKGGPARWTIILGDNGTGKTTLLQCLVALQPTHVAIQDSMKVKPLATPAFNPNGMKLYRQLQRDVLSHDFFHRDIDIPTHLRSTFSNSHSFSRVNNALPKSSFSLKLRDHGYESEVNWSYSASDGYDFFFRSVFCAYGAGRKMGSSSLANDELDNPVISIFSDNSTLQSADEWLLRADYAARRATRNEGKAHDRLNSIKNVLVKILPDVDKINLSNPMHSADTPSVEFHTPYGWVTLDKLSLGYKTLIAWTVDLASWFFEKYPRHKNPLAQPAIVLVDEIDLHLHPKWQRNLVQYLSDLFPKTQFIVTAHSPLIVQAAQDANLAVLRREKDHVVIDQSMKAVRGWRVDQVLSSDLFDIPSLRPPEFDDLLAERKRLLTKPKLTESDKTKLKKIDADLGNLPAGASIEDSDAMQLIRRAAQNIKSSGE
ncbi:MAG: AAA family ATPase, partial [Rhodospirillaceae bacterium]|nr:AAA family ATPase [Rhodospirillaceae bacterium]MBT5778883.1 AAA family ATPase [Rhodospirillaceae bacterium]